LEDAERWGKQLELASADHMFASAK